jgi:Glycosyl hydrolase family 26
LLIVAGILGGMGVAVLLTMSESGSASGVMQRADPPRVSVPAVDPSAISAVPDSLATAQDPSKQVMPSTPEPVVNSPAPTDSASGTRSGGTITAGDSKAHCITPNFPGGVLDQSVISKASSLTGISYNCLETFANPMPTWDDWEAPWMFSTTSDGWDAWLAANPAHQVVMGMDLIPQSVSDNTNPLTWEQPCAAGAYNQYATALAQNLVSYGAGSIVIRLGIEANGNWEADYVGSTTQEMNDWAQCFDNEVTAMRAVPGTSFLFVWNPNACTANLPLSGWYPGNSYVDIIGVDAYDEDCSTLKTVSQEGWAAYATNSATNNPNDPNFPSLDNIAAFAASHGKSLSFPEWGIDSGLPDDATYVADMAQIISQRTFSFESYFDTNDHGIVPLGPAIPNATAAYSQAFK